MCSKSRGGGGGDDGVSCWGGESGVSCWGGEGAAADCFGLGGVAVFLIILAAFGDEAADGPVRKIYNKVGA